MNFEPHGFLNKDHSPNKKQGEQCFPEITLLPTKVEQNVASDGVVATHSVVEIDAGPRSIERNVAVEYRVEGLSLKEKTVLLCVYAQLMRQIHDDASSSRLVSTARIEPHARDRTAVGKTPLNEDVMSQVNVTNYTSHVSPERWRSHPLQQTRCR